MSDQNTLERTLEMMAVLSRAGGQRVEDLAEEFGVTTRTIRRTIKTIRDSGYVVESKGGYYRLERDETKRKFGVNIGDLLYFSKEEAYILSAAIDTIDTTTNVRETLVKKLYSLYNSDKVAFSVTRQEDKAAVKIILEAIRDKKQVKIKEFGYSTANQGIYNAIVEPLGFAFNFSRFWAYFPERHGNIIIRLSNVLGVEATNQPFKYVKEHRIGYTDAFRGYGIEQIKVNLLMNRRAYGLMIDEFPLSKESITPDKLNPVRTYRLETYVCTFREIGRFIMGLPGDIAIIEPQELKDYIKSKLEEGIESLIPEPQYAIIDNPSDLWGD